MMIGSTFEAMRYHLDDDDDRENFAAFAKAIEEDRDDPHPYASRGLLCEELGMYDQAISDFTKFMELARPQFIYAYKRGVLNFLTHRYEQAIDDLSWVLDDIAPIETDYRQSALRYRAEALLRVGRPQQALEDIDRVLRLLENGTDECTDAVAMRAVIEKALAAHST